MEGSPLERKAQGGQLALWGVGFSRELARCGEDWGRGSLLRETVRVVGAHGEALRVGGWPLGCRVRVTS